MVEPVGRQLAVQWWGDPEGYPVFLLHGMPGSRLGPRPRGIVLERMGIRLISYDRPGYGRSDRRPGRRVVDAAADVERIADHLGLERFAIAGRSGGGPHALACAACLGDRVERLAMLVSVAPPDAEGLTWDDGMAEVNTRDYADVDRSVADAPADAAPHAAILIERAAQMQQDPETLIRFLLPELSGSDRRFVEDRAIRNLLAATYAEAVLHGGGGWVDDAAALRSPWGFDFEDVSCPVLLWHGGDDRFSPVAHTRWLAERLRAVRGDKIEVSVRIEPGQAHFAAFEVFVEVLDWLRGPPPVRAPVRTAADREPGEPGCHAEGPARSGVLDQSPLQAVR